MDELSVDFEPQIGGDVRRRIVDGLIHHNMAASGAVDDYPANFVLRSAKREVVGGLLADIWGGWMEVHILWVAQTLRGQGHATRLMSAAEAYAVEKGCVGINLDTFSFQARPFYERLGFAVFGQLDDYPRGHTRFYMVKRLG